MISLDTISGLQLVERRRGTAYFRSDGRHHTLCYIEGEQADEATGFALPPEADLAAIAGKLDDARVPVQEGTPSECEERHVERFIRFHDPSGNCIELLGRPHESRAGISQRGMRASRVSATSVCERRMPSGTKRSGRRSSTLA